MMPDNLPPISNSEENSHSPAGQPADFSAQPPGSEGMSDPGDSPPASDEPQGPSLIRRLVRGLFFLFLLFLVVVVGVGIYAYTRFQNLGDLKTLAEQRASEAIGLPVRVETVELGFPTIRLRGVQVGVPEKPDLPRASVGDVKVGLDFWALLGSQVVFEELVVSSASLVMTRAEDGQFILPPELAPASPSAAAALASEPRSLPLSMRHIALANVVVRIRSHGDAPEFTLELTGGSLRDALFGSARSVQLSGRVRDLIAVEMTGSLEPDGALVAQVTLRDLDLPGVKRLVPVLASTWPPSVSNPQLALEFRYDPHGGLIVRKALLTATPNIEVSAFGTLDSFSPLTGSASFSLAPLPVPVLIGLAGPFLPALPLKLESGTMAAGGSVILASGSPTIRGWVKPSAVRAVIPGRTEPLTLNGDHLEWAGSTVSWKNIKLDGPGVQLVAPEGRLALAPAYKGSGKVDLRLDAGLAWPMVKGSLPADLATLDPAGTISFVGELSGKDGAIKLDGQVKASAVRVRPQKAWEVLEISELVATVKNLSQTTGEALIDRARVKMWGQDLSVAGKITNGASPQFALGATATVDLAVLQQRLPIENEMFKKKAQVGGQAELSVRLLGTAADPKPQIGLSLKKGLFSMPAQGLDLKDIEGRLRGSMTEAVADRLSASIAGGKITLTGGVRDFAKPVLNASGTATGIDLAEIRTFLGRNFPTFPSELVFSGKADLDVALSGSAETPNISGTARLANAGVFHPAMLRELTRLQGPVSFTKTGLQTKNLQANWGSSTVRLDGAMTDWASFRLDLGYVVEPLDLTDIGGFFLKGTGYQMTGMGNSRGKVTGPIAQIVLAGQANAPSLTFVAPVTQGGETFRFPVENVAVTYRYTDGLLTVQKVTGGMFGGTIDGSGNVYLKREPLMFDLDVRGAKVRTERFLAINTKLKDALTGPVDLTFIATGTTVGLNSLNGRSTLSMAQGSYQAPPFAAQIFQQLELGHLSSGTITNANGGFLFQNGRMNSNDLLFKSSAGSMTYKGSVGLDTTLDGTAEMQLPRQTCQGSRILRDLVGNSPTLDIPVGVKGSIMSPRIDLRLDTLVKRAAEQKAKGFLTDLLRGGKSSPSEQGALASSAVQVDGAPPAGSLATGTVPASPPPKPPDPVKKIESEIKNIGKDLKKIFKF
jgi:hypothetical protein